MNLKDYILFYAFRYALGRKSYAVKDVVSEIASHKDELTFNDRSIMIKEIEEYKFDDGEYSDKWLKLSEELKKLNNNK